ncbi:unnamed protein product [Paramecium octaurelia]|uniref:EF-hand domain-containing protein n=1 Tax=Paramecium octaurelia TaxID=43137 RepID=A0A8S1W1G9_PAROT|nr:unnamed protein product [Paramecium octaurelia]
MHIAIISMVLIQIYAFQATLIQQYSRIHPQNIKKKSPTSSDRISKSMDKTKPRVERQQIRSETIDVVMRPTDPILEEVHSQKQKIINQRVVAVNTFNRILNVDRVGHRMQRGQLLRYLREFYSQIIVEQINRVLKVPDTLTLQMYEQLITSLQQLDRQQYLNLCFQIYDLSGQGVITSTNLLSLLSVEKNTSIVENDILTMIKLRSSLLKSQLDKSESSRLPKLRTIVINHKRASKGKRIMISQIEEEEVDQSVIHPINRLKLIDKNHTETTEFIPKRMAVAVAILILFVLHYVTLLINAFLKGPDQKEYINRRVFLFGIAGLLSMSTIQSSVFSAILAWLTFVPLAVLHLSIYEKFQNLNNHKDTLWLAYYGLQFVWFLGIIIDFYS